MDKGIKDNILLGYAKRIQDIFDELETKTGNKLYGFKYRREGYIKEFDFKK